MDSDDKLKKDLRAIADGQGAHQVPDQKQTAKEALQRIEDLEKKPKVVKDKFISNR